ncbi:hypothetical protein [Burkholderia diffusa]|uniref:hypothetical protein n=1 Tax=Burkholderia diffusa TaxID=488732 RepID=UPI002AB2705F|nr:hypothetical protein [Burkholderia diffusa]
MKKKIFLAGLMGSAVLLAACGGGDDNGGGASAPAANSTGTATPTTTAAFSCPSDYKKMSLSNSSVIANANLNLRTDDGIAVLTIKTPADGKTGDLIICLGKPNPVPAGVKADYVYEVKSSSDLHAMASSTLTLNFTTNTVPNPNPPVIEFADVSNGAVTYKSLTQGASYATAPNYTLAASAQDSGLYVVRLTK